MDDAKQKETATPQLRPFFARSRQRSSSAAPHQVILAELRRQAAELPDLEMGEQFAPPAPPLPKDSETQQALSKQGRILVRQSAALESLEKRVADMTEQLQRQTGELDRQRAERRTADERARTAAGEAIHLMDALDWIREALSTPHEHPLAREVASSQRDAARRLAAIGITEIPAMGVAADGRLHESLGTTAAADIPRYQVVSVVRRGWQWGTEILRRAGVITAE